ncbi:hypothetical protein PVAP13_7KG038727 [Panicum virgatum]|uniref:Uncharacterized protein n=1 Tax=Panicum virgatum TaxID=38727 RepID=A0A8T0QBU6_PANVG|nr:hypothetical protein PVAP13_7KG038727 [Panicum virgatum]
MVAFWDILLGLDAIKLITMASTFLLLHEIVKMECRKLEERARMLGALLRSPASRRIMIQQQDDLELGRLVTNAIKDAHDLVECYNGRTLLARVRRGRSMATQFRDLRSSIDCYCGLILSVNAVLLAVQGNQLPPPTPTLTPPAAAAAALAGDTRIIDISQE